MTNTLEALSLVVVTELYNLIAEKPVKKFESKAKGIARLAALLQEKGQEVFNAGTDEAPDYDIRPIAVEEKPVITFTDLEYRMMDTIAHSEYTQDNGATPTDYKSVNVWLWADEFGRAIGISAKAAGGVLSSLDQKGAIGMDVSGKKKDNAVWFTEAGFAAWKADHDAGRTGLEETFTPEEQARMTAVGEKAKAKKAKKEAGGKRGPAPQFADGMKITEVVANPKREGTSAHARFSLYKAGMTVGEYLKAGGTRSDLAWDTDARRNFVKIGK
jgi:hypothetical protein